MGKHRNGILVFLAAICAMAILGFCLYQFLPLTHLHGQQLGHLSDAKLLKTVLSQIAADEHTAPDDLPEHYKTVYVLNTYEKEMEGGGLCLFFINETRKVAPYVEESLKIAGADAHLALFSDFIAKNNIDVHDLDSFAIKDIEEYALQDARYDFGTYDDQYYALPLLKDILIGYIRANIDLF